MDDKVRRIVTSEQVSFFHIVNVMLKLNKCRIIRPNVDKTTRPRSLPLVMIFVDYDKACFDKRHVSVNIPV